MLEVYCVPSVLKQIDAIPVGAGFRGPGTSSACLVDLVLPFAAGLAFFERSGLRRRVRVLAVAWRFLALRLAEAPFVLCVLYLCHKRAGCRFRLIIS